MDITERVYALLKKNNSELFNDESKCLKDIDFFIQKMIGSSLSESTFVIRWYEAFFQVMYRDNTFVETFINSIIEAAEELKETSLISNIQSAKTNNFVIEESLIKSITDYHILCFKNIDPVSAEKDREKITEDGKKHIEFLNEAVNCTSPEIFIDYCKWVESVLNSLNIESISFIRFLLTIKCVLQHEEKSSLQIEYLDLAIANLLNTEKLDNCEVEKSNAHKAYLNHLLNGQRKEASELVFDLLNQGKTIHEIYIQIFQEAQYEIGRLWELNQISVAQEHYCTASTQMIISQLYPYIFSEKKRNKNIVATCVGKELHEMGIRMISDFLEMDGWDTYYLGANTPKEAVLASIKDYKADILAISVTMTPHLKHAIDLIKEIKSNSMNDLKIIVGGYPFLSDTELWKKIGADGFAMGAQEVCKVADELIKNEG